MIRENQSLELKETVSNSFLKTVSAFANYHDGEIIFGVNDEGDIVGIEDIQKTCLSIENQINDSIKPKPDYSLKTNLDRTITLSVKKGQNTPYRYHGKAYKRNDTATIEVDEIEENRLVLQGMNLSFEELPSKEQELFFDYLSRKIKEALDLESFNKVIKKPIPKIGIAKAEILKLKPKSETIQAVIVVPILAPKITPTDCARVKSPALIKDTTITVVAPDD